MDFSLFTTLTPTTLALALGIAFFAGLVKGVVGFAVPLILVSGLSSFLDPKLAIAGLIVPVLVTNLLQVLRTGWQDARAAVAEHWRYILMVCLAIAIVAQGAARIPTQMFYVVLGVPVVILSLIQLFGVHLTIPVHRRRAAEWIVGGISGVLGGLVGTWGVTTVLYLLAIETPKAKQMIVQGVIYGTGSVALVLAHLQSGLFNAQTAPFSAALLPLAVVGLWCGFAVQDRMDQARFRQVTLVILLLAGLNLLRKGLLG